MLWKISLNGALNIYSIHTCTCFMFHQQWTQQRYMQKSKPIIYVLSGWQYFYFMPIKAYQCSCLSLNILLAISEFRVVLLVLQSIGMTKHWNSCMTVRKEISWCLLWIHAFTDVVVEAYLFHKWCMVAWMCLCVQQAQGRETAAGDKTDRCRDVLCVSLKSRVVVECKHTLMKFTKPS